MCAGFPSPANDYLEGEIDLNRYLINNPLATFIVKSQGNCMLQAGIHSGDLLIVDRSIKSKNNSIVIASIDGDLTVKRVKTSGEKFFLTSDNSSYRNVKINNESDIFIWGTVTKVIHDVY
ncbi:MAG: LexA repressor [Alphaproteobacteria bacterium MarineAlpha6_Bin4]|nr:MAG: LexA repressor [Alphaproteobacteria bacterium MarineAlpha6_Bin4]